MWIKRSVAALLAAVLALPLLAGARPFPSDIKRGRMTPGYYPDLTIDGKARKLSPASRIFNEDNMITMPASLRGSGIVVYYTEDANGDIKDVWILTDEEAAQDLPAPAK
jgi:hypothetical protein